MRASGSHPHYRNQLLITAKVSDTFPAFQQKPAHKPSYTERAKAGLLPPKQRQPVSKKPRKAMRKVAKKNTARDTEYKDWLKIVMHGISRCERCKEHRSGSLQPHHPSGRKGEHLFEVVAVCDECHTWIHEYPNFSFAAGWLTPAYRGYQPIPNHPQPFKYLPHP